MTDAVIGTCTHRMVGGGCWRWAGGLVVHRSSSDSSDSGNQQEHEASAQKKQNGYLCSNDAIALTEAGEQLHAAGTCTSL